MTKTKGVDTDLVHPTVQRPGRLTDDQRLELAACYAEYCGVDPQDRVEWRMEMPGAKKFVRELMAIWRKRDA